jgi:hypothetical protein
MVFAQNHSEDLYNQWHDALAKYAYLGEADWFHSEGAPAEYAQAVRAIDNAGFAMADFICAKVAAESTDESRLYQDMFLLMHVTGIDLLRGDQFERSYKESQKRNVEDFKRNWRAGVYADVSPYIRKLCEQLTDKNEDDNLNPLELRPIRRYGLYGIPELVRQIKINGSNHAFAAYLIMTGNSSEYREYMNRPKLIFRSREEKLAHMEKWLGTKKGQIANNCMGGKIANALRAQ